MTDGSGLNEAFNNAIDDLIPDDVDPSEIESDSASKPAEDAPVQENRNWGTLLREWHALASVDEYRRDELARREFNRFGEALDLPPTAEQMAEQLFKQYVATQDHLIVELTAAAAIYCAAKVNELGVTPDEIVDAGPDPLDRTILLRRSKAIVGELGLDPSAFFDSQVYVDRFGEELNLPDIVTERAKEILSYCDEAGVSSGKSPTGWAASAIYLACLETDQSVSQDEIASVADVSEVTIRNRYQEQNEVVLREEQPTEDLIAVVDWTCDRVGLPDQVRTDARKYADADVEISVDSSDQIPSSFEEDPVGWGMAVVKCAADENEHSLTYRPLKSLSGCNASELRQRVQVLNRALRGVQLTHHDENDPSRPTTEGDVSSVGATESPVSDADRESTPDDTAELPDGIVQTLEDLDDNTLRALRETIDDLLSETSGDDVPGDITESNSR